MNRSYKRLIRIPPKPFESEGRISKVSGSKSDVEVEEVLPSKPRKSGKQALKATLIGDKKKTNRCTFYRPSYNDFGQLTDIEAPDNYQKILREQFGFEPNVPETIEKLKKFKKLLSQNENMVENSSQCAEPRIEKCNKQTHNVVGLSEESQWQNVDTTDELERYLRVCRVKDAEVQNALSDAKSSIPTSPTNIRISETPRVKVIAEKYSKYKRNNMELRRLEEKVVCLEYDIFDLDAATAKPFQKMRAFFSIKPNKKSQGSANIVTSENEISSGRSEAKHNFNMIFNMIDDADLNKLNKTEIEIIDGEIPENRLLLEDLKKVLRRQQAIQNKKKQTTLDLMSLYEMAKRESPPLDENYSNMNLLSTAELQEIKDLILKKCASSAYGIRRRTVKTGKRDESARPSAMSASLIAELMREPQKDTSI